MKLTLIAFKTAGLAATSFVALALASVRAEASTINLPIGIALSVLEERLNNEVPKRLATISEPNRVCIERQKIKYEYPCFRGIQIYSCDGWTWGSPAVRCDVNGHVELAGRISLAGSGNTISAAVPVAASVSARAAGISETANARATITGAITPSIDENWQVNATVKPDLRWNQRPELRLFGLIRITIGSKVEPKVREYMDAFVGRLPTLLTEMDVRGQVEKVWDELQEPIAISGTNDLHLTFAPETVGFSGIHIADGLLRANVALSGHAQIVSGDVANPQKVPLAKLTKIPHDERGFQFSLPVNLNHDSIEAFIAEQFPDGYTTELDAGGLNGTLTLENLQLSGSAENRLGVRMDIAYDDRSRLLRFIDVFDWFDTSGTLSFMARPVIDAKTQKLTIESLALESDTDNLLADTLLDVANLPLLRDFISAQIAYDFGDDVDEAIKAVNTAMNRDLGEGIALSGTLENAGITGLAVSDDAISVILNAQGTVTVDIASP